MFLSYQNSRLSYLRKVPTLIFKPDALDSIPELSSCWVFYFFLVLLHPFLLLLLLLTVLPILLLISYSSKVHTFEGSLIAGIFFIPEGLLFQRFVIFICIVQIFNLPIRNLTSYGIRNF